ncbi:MAG: hypothetical protein DCC55_29900 [Chloroflexi bacterium]|nr:MAG: hypothetical protein DCC55_29900 [Chloroflexota bacterium]
MFERNRVRRVVPRTAPDVEATGPQPQPDNQRSQRSDFVTLACPSCGGTLQITKEIDRFACSYCGNEHLVRREGGLVYLAPIAEDIRHIRGGVDKTAAELAVARLTKEAAALEQTFTMLAEWDDDEWLPPSPLEKWAPVLTFVLPSLMTILLGLYPATPLATLACLGIPVSFFGCIALTLLLRKKRMRAIHKMRTAELSELEAMLGQKQQLLARNRLIVDG